MGLRDYVGSIMGNGYTPLLSEITRRFENADYLSPKKIIVQIFLLQICYYMVALILCGLISTFSGYPFTLDWVFSWVFVVNSNTLGWTLCGMWIFDTLICVLFMTIIVGRSKLAWDFALTLHTMNLLVVWIYSQRFPSSVLWWILQGVSAFVLVSLGTWTSRWKELQKTFFEGSLDVETGIGNGNSDIPLSTVHEVTNDPQESTKDRTDTTQ